MKYLACDLDGTLVQHNQTINTEDIEAIKRLKQKGYKFIISTGRSLDGIYKIFKNYPDIEYDYIVACNGSLIINKDKAIIYDNFIDSKVAEKVFEDFIDDDGICVHYECNGQNYLIDPKTEDGIEHLMNYFNGGVVCKEDVFGKADKYSLISLFARHKDNKIAEEAKNKLLEKYGVSLEAFRNQYFIDIAPKGCSKGSALKKIIEYDKADIEKLYVIGDSFNDLSMFKVTNNSFTFHYAEEELKSYAQYHVSSVKECIDIILSE